MANPDIKEKQTKLGRGSLVADRGRLLREGVAAAFIAAASVCTTAAFIYFQDRNAALDDVRQQVKELATGASQLLSMVGHERLAAGAKSDSAALEVVRQKAAEFMTSHPAVVSIRTFRIDSDPPAPILHEVRGPFAERRDPATGEILDGPADLRAELMAGRGHFRTDPATVQGVPTLDGFTAIRAQNGEIYGGLHLTVNVQRTVDRLSHLRHRVFVASGTGVLLGALAGYLYWRTRSREADTARLLSRMRRVDRLTVEALGAILYEWNLDSGAVRWRGYLKPVLGLTANQMGDGIAAWRTRIHPEDVVSYEAEMKRAVSTQTSFQLTYRVLHENGKHRWVMERSLATEIEPGTPLVLGAILDVTQQRASEERFQIFFEQSATAHIVFFGDDILDANPAAVHMLGRSSTQELAGTPLWKLWPARQKDGQSGELWSQHVLDAVENGEAHFEWLFCKRGGTDLYADVYLNSAALVDRPVLLMACYDLTETRSAQASLVESEKRFRDVSEAAGEFIWEVGPNGHYVYASPRVSDILGMAPPEVVGRHPLDFVLEQERETVTQFFEEVIAAKRPFRGFEYQVRAADGRIIWVDVSGVPILHEDGSLAGYRGASLNVTDRREYEQALLLQKEAAESADRAKSNFLAMMSHEIRTPLNSVLGFTDLLLHTPLQPQQRDFLATIRQSGDALLVLLNDILDFSKIESGRMEIEMHPTNVADCVREVIELYQVAAESKHLRLEWSVDADVPRWIQTDPARLRQILLNLVGNAVKFTSAGSVSAHVSVLDRSDRNRGEWVRFTVSDTGVGIPADKVDRLFLPFSQADSSTTRKYGGTGLGLAISKRLAELLGGELGLLKSSNSGATFYVDVAAAAAPAPVPSLPAKDFFLPPPSDLDESPSPHVLVVDDNPINRRLTMQMLALLGADSTAAADAHECFAMIEAQAFDVVLMDVQMPGMDGIEATRIIRLRELEGTIAHRHRIIALTADAMPGDRERCLSAGMDDYLSKPIRRDALAAALRPGTSDETARNEL